MKRKQKKKLNKEELAKFLCHIDGCSDYLFNSYIFYL